MADGYGPDRSEPRQGFDGALWPRVLPECRPFEVTAVATVRLHHALSGEETLDRVFNCPVSSCFTMLTLPQGPPDQ